MSLTPSKMVPLGTKASDFSLRATAGNMINLDTFNDAKVFVLMFICNHCPYVIHIRDGLAKLVNDFENKNASFLAINSNDADNYLEDSFEKMQEYSRKYNYPYIYAFDEDQSVAKAYGAACTPDFFMYDLNRTLIYRGQMDDSRPGNNVPVTGDDLRNVINLALNDKPIPEKQKPSAGCNIKWKDNGY